MRAGERCSPGHFAERVHQSVPGQRGPRFDRVPFGGKRCEGIQRET